MIRTLPGPGDGWLQAKDRSQGTAMMSTAAIDAMPEALEKLEGFANKTTGNGTEQII